MRSMIRLVLLIGLAYYAGIGILDRLGETAFYLSLPLFLLLGYLNRENHASGRLA